MDRMSGRFVDKVVISTAQEWANNEHAGIFMEEPVGSAFDPILPENWETEEYQEIACVAQQLYAEKMGWTK